MHRNTWVTPDARDLGTVEDAKRKTLGLINDALLGAS